MLQSVAVRCVAVCCSVLQCAAHTVASKYVMSPWRRGATCMQPRKRQCMQHTATYCNTHATEDATVYATQFTHAPKIVGVQAALHDNRARRCKEHVWRHRAFDGRLRAEPCDPCRTRQPSLTRCFSNTAVLTKMERQRGREGGGGTWIEIALYPPAVLNERGIHTRVNGGHSNGAVGAPLLSHGGLSVSRMPHQSFHPRRVRFLCATHRYHTQTCTHAHAHARTHKHPQPHPHTLTHIPPSPGNTGN